MEIPENIKSEWKKVSESRGHSDGGAYEEIKYSCGCEEYFGWAHLDQDVSLTRHYGACFIPGCRGQMADSFGHHHITYCPRHEQMAIEATW